MTKQWQAEKEYFKSILSEFPLEEVVRWGKPCYQYQGANLFLLAGFKEHCCLMIFNGALLKDTKNRLVRAGENTQAARQFRIHSMDELVRDEKQLRQFIKESIALEKAGTKVELKPSESPQPDIAEWNKLLKKRPDVKKAFTALTPGRQRAYLIHFSGAKQSATRESRIEKVLERILAGKGMND
ncbi:MAG: hypothetical protein FGM54_01785 [Chitinophagaceae bacterium]|nr:hypothetical protein [Chitinophagaceae bacterium]